MSSCVSATMLGASHLGIALGHRWSCRADCGRKVLGKVVQFGRQPIGAVEAPLGALKSNLAIPAGAEVEKIEAVTEVCELLLESITKLQQSLDNLDREQCMFVEPGDRQAVAEQVVSARSQLSMEFGRLADVLFTLSGTAGQVSRLDAAL